MLTFKVAAATTASPAMAMATYLTDEANQHELAQKLAAYYDEEMAALVAGVPRQDMHPLLAEKLGIDPSKGLTKEQIANLLMGNRTDGARIPGKQIQRNTQDKVRTAYIDLAFQAPKSFSVALALAQTERERAKLDLAFRRALDRVMVDVEGIIGVARKGKGGRDGHEKGHVAWAAFHHFSARPTTMIPKQVDGQDATEIAAIKVVGDPHRHAHVIVPNAVVTDKGRVTSLHLMRMHERVLEIGAVFQAYLGVELRKDGVEWEADSDTTKSIHARRGRLTAIPRWLEEHYSKRSANGEEAARKFAADRGIDWATLSPEQRIRLLKTGATLGRQAKEGPPDFEAWMQQAQDAGYEHRSVLRPDDIQEMPSAEIRQQGAYETSLPILAPELERRGVFEGAIAREAAAIGFIQWGLQSIKEIDRVTKAYRTEGVLQDGRKTNLKWGRYQDKKWAQFTTGLHVAQEREAIDLLREAAADFSLAIPAEIIEAAAEKLTRERGYDFTNEQGLAQLEMAKRLGAAGAATVGIGVAGAGKGVVLSVLAEAAHSLGYRTMGTTVAWRQAAALGDTGVGKRKPARKKEADTKVYEDARLEKSDTFALTKFLHGVERGYIKPDNKTIVFVDEIAQVGTRQVLKLSQFRKQFGFKIAGFGDDLQCQSIDAGSTVKLMRRALGATEVPEILETVRQENEEDRLTSLMFREGKESAARTALDRKLAAGLLEIVPGGYEHAIRAGVDRWEERVAARANDPKATVAISVPTNSDARAIGQEVRRRRLARAAAAGTPVGTTVELEATDQTGLSFSLEVSPGDRVRLFRELKNEDGSFGYNGTTVEVASIDPASGMTVRRDDGREMTVSWGSLRSQRNGRIMLTYGYALTIDSRQGDTNTDHITVMPGGSSTVNAYKAYTSDSRNRQRSYIITSQGMEQQEIIDRRPLNDPRNDDKRPAAVNEAILQNMARNLSRQDEKTLATDFEDKARDLHAGTVDAMRASWYRRAQGQTGRGAYKRRQAEAAAQEPAQRAVNALLVHQAAVRKAAEQIAKTPRPSRKAKPTRAPRQKQEAPTMTQAEARAEFSRKLDAIGLMLNERGVSHPIADGRIHYVSTIGAKKGSKRGSYFLSENGLGGWAVNHATNERITWTAAKVEGRILTPEERQRLDLEKRRAREQALNAQRQREEDGAIQALRIWNASRPAKSHPYLTRKMADTHGTRIAPAGMTATMTEGRTMNIGGRLLVPMMDINGKIWNLQTINARGDKFYLPGRKQGLFFDLGEPASPTEARVLVEGLATGDALRTSTALSTRVTFDSANMVHVGVATRRAEPDRPLIYASDNDHHLPGVTASVIADETGTIRYAWKAGVTGDAHKGNTVQYRLAGMPEWQTAARGMDQAGTAIVVPGQAPGARYEVRVFAEHRLMPRPNEGIEKATKAASLTGGTVVTPDFQPGDKGTDWKDYALDHGGADMAKQRMAVRAAFEAKGIKMPDQANVERKSTITQSRREDAMRQAAQKRQDQAQRSQDMQRRQQESQRQAPNTRPAPPGLGA
jgi:phage/plasmid primase-like uncharacterized protein